MKKRDSLYEFAGEQDFLFKKLTDDGTVLNPKEPISDEMLLSCRGVNKSYGSVKAIRNLSLDIPRGKIVGLLGPNGSGKTTLIKLISGLLTIDSGDIRVLGKTIGVRTKKYISYLPERNSLPLHFTVADAVRFYKDFFFDFDKIRAEKILDDLSIDKKKKIKSLSKGMREKVNLALGNIS